MPSTSRGYRAAVRLGVMVAPAFGLLNPKLRAGLKARREAGDRLLDWARWNRDPSRPLVWFHAASVGEGRQAESVLQALRRRRPDCQIVYTHFSPSAEALASAIGADAADYLPFDLPANVDRLLQVVQPNLLIFAKLDVWAELATRAATSGVEVALVAATVGPGSSRLRWPARQLLRPGYRAIAAAAAVAPADAARLERLGVERERIQVLGDPRFDSVVERVARVRPDDPLLRLGAGAPTLVAGSTWAADERVVLQAFAALLRSRADARLLLVPHEPGTGHLGRLEDTARGFHLPRPMRLSSMEGPGSLVVVDRLGILSTLYGTGTMAYVGGGFGRAGLHSVLEPAAWRIPVVFGPAWRNSRDAELLLQARAAVALPRSGPAEALEQQWADWLRDEDGRAAQGRRAREVVEQGLGAADRSAELLARFISARRPRR